MTVARVNWFDRDPGGGTINITPAPVPFALDLDTHELTRLSAVLTACGDNLDLVTMHATESTARRLLYSNLSPEQRRIYGELHEAGVLGADL